MSNGKLFTADEDAVIIQGHREGKSCREIAEQLKRSFGSVKSRRVRLGLRTYRPKEQAEPAPDHLRHDEKFRDAMRAAGYVECPPKIVE